MRILISAGYYNNTKCADNHIAVCITEQLIKKGHQAEIIGLTDDLEYDDTDCKVPIHRISSRWKILNRAFLHFHEITNQESRSLTKKEILEFLFKHPISFLLIFFSHIPYLQKHMLCSYADQTVKYMSANKFDALLCVVYPFLQAKPLILDPRIQCTKIYYQLDPYGTSRVLPQNETMNRKIEEVAVMQASDIVITTKEMELEYLSDPIYAPIRNKLSSAEFPTMLPLTSISVNCPISFEKDKTNILFCGTANDNIRNPSFFIQFMDQYLQTHPSFKIYFLGDVQSNAIVDFQKRNPDAVTIFAPVKQEFALAAMKSCDCLLNIGNSVINMVPSKIFTYFATGKPIINMEVDDTYPENRYIKKYPLQITLFSNQSFDDNLDHLDSFLHSNLNRTINEKEVLQIFNDSTPSSVVDSILQRINNSNKSS